MFRIVGLVWCHLCEAIAVSSYMITPCSHFQPLSSQCLGLRFVMDMQLLFETVASYDIKMTQQSLLLKDTRFGVLWQKCKTYDKNLGSSGGCLTFCFGLKQIDEMSEKFLSWKFRVQL